MHKRPRGHECILLIECRRADIRGDRDRDLEVGVHEQERAAADCVATMVHVAASVLVAADSPGQTHVRVLAILVALR